MSRRAALLLVALVVVVGAVVVVAAGGDDADEEEQVVTDGLTGVEVEHTEPLVAGEPVTWRVTAVVEGVAVPVTFRSGQRADVRLFDGDREVYRWSAGLSFTQAISEETLEPGRTPYELEEPALDVPPGDYELVAELTTTSRPESARRAVTVESR